MAGPRLRVAADLEAAAAADVVAVAGARLALLRADDHHQVDEDRPRGAAREAKDADLAGRAGVAVGGAVEAVRLADLALAAEPARQRPGLGPVPAVGEDQLRGGADRVGEPGAVGDGQRLDGELLARLEVAQPLRVDDVALQVERQLGRHAGPAAARPRVVAVARVQQHRVDPPPVLGDRAVGLVAADDQHVPPAGVRVAGADHEVDEAAVGRAGQPARVVDADPGAGEDEHAVMLARLPLPADGAPAGADRQAARRARRARQHQPCREQRVVAVRRPDAALDPPVAVQRHLDLGRELEPVALAQPRQPLRPERHHDPLRGAGAPRDRQPLEPLRVVAAGRDPDDVALLAAGPRRRRRGGEQDEGGGDRDRSAHRRDRLADPPPPPAAAPAGAAT